MKLPQSDDYPSVRETMKCPKPPDFCISAPSKSLPTRISKGTSEDSGRFPERVFNIASKVLCSKARVLEGKIGVQLYPEDKERENLPRNEWIPVILRHNSRLLKVLSQLRAVGTKNTPRIRP